MFALEEELLRLLRHVKRRHGAHVLRATDAAPGLVRARQRLHDAIELPVSLAELAALAGVSRFQLLRGFARAFGVTPHAYLVQLRVQRVRRLLADGAVPADAALQAGFADQSHMTRAFVRQFGVTPARYRAALR
jgi:AraC-like DNA-binding protein